MDTNVDLQTPILAVNNLKVYYKNGKGSVYKAVDDISFTIRKGETYGLVGESGSGKSTTVRAILKLVDATSGQIYYNGQNITALKEKAFRNIRKEIQMIFQDPLSSLDPKKRIGESIEEVLTIHQMYTPSERTAKSLEMLMSVGLAPEHYYKFPYQISGGQAQRVSIARALITNPSFLACDEPVSSLDVSIQAQILNLLLELKEKLQLTLIFIAHNLGVVRHISDRIGTMYMGHLVEEAPTDLLFSNARHPYTQLLMASIPVPDPMQKRERISFPEESAPVNDSGCIFRGKCPKAAKVCGEQKPEYKQVDSGHFVACHLC